MFDKLKHKFGAHNKSTQEQPINPVVSENDIQQQQQAIANQQRQQVEAEYRREHPDQIRQEKELSFEHKTNKLKKKLNIAIITVFGLIIIVFLILFFV